MKYSEAWAELEKRLRRMRKEAQDQCEAAQKRGDYPSIHYCSGKRFAAERIIDLMDDIEWEFE